MTELPRYSTNAIVMMEIDDDLDDEEQPLATDPDGDWVKWADVSSRLQQLESSLEEVRHLAVIRGDAYADVFTSREALKAQVEQLEQEKATLREFVDRCAELGATDTDIIKHALEDQARIRAEMTPLSIEASELRAALAETREALHQIVCKDCIEQHVYAQSVSCYCECHKGESASEGEIREKLTKALTRGDSQGAISDASVPQGQARGNQ